MKVKAGLCKCDICKEFKIGVSSYYDDLGEYEALCLEHYDKFKKGELKQKIKEK